MSENAKWYVIHTYSGYENAVKTSIEKFVDRPRHGGYDPADGDPHGDRDRGHGLRRRQGSGAQGVPRLCADQDGHDRRHLASGAECPRRHRLCGHRQQAHPPDGGGGACHGHGKARDRGAATTWATMCRSWTAPWPASPASWRRSSPRRTRSASWSPCSAGRPPWSWSWIRWRS